MKTFAEDPLVLERGEGVRVTDDRGRTYRWSVRRHYEHSRPWESGDLGRARGAGATSRVRRPDTRHQHARRRVGRQLLTLAWRFTTVKPLSGGSETNEAAIKLARQFHKQTGNATKFKVVAHCRGYHGGTGNALAASGWAAWQNAFGPLPGGFVHLHTPDVDSPPYPSLSPEEASESYIRLMRATVELEGPETIAAIITEPILMSAGVIVPPDSYMRALRAVCDERSRRAALQHASQLTRFRATAPPRGGAGLASPFG
jgi:4-aminobutyrate aminotransferase-like enzyme